MSKEREAIKKLGRSPEWLKKVKEMPEDQVIAIYLSALGRGKL